METGQKKKTRQGAWIKEAKAKADAVDALLREHGVASVDDLNRLLKDVTGVVPEADAPRGPVEPGSDPLAWITKDTPFVGLVSSTSLFVLRPKRTDVSPHIARVALRARSVGAWAGCPFYIGDRSNHTHDQNVKVYKESWWHHTLTKPVAESIWHDERTPRPTEAVVDPLSFKGWDNYSKTARGETVQLEEFVPLRETVRRLLQKAPDTFLDWVNRPKGHEFDRRVPNPYRNKISDVVREFKTERFE